MDPALCGRRPLGRDLLRLRSAENDLRYPRGHDRAAVRFGAAVVAVVPEGMAAFSAQLPLRISVHSGHCDPLCALYRVCGIRPVVGDQ